MPFPLALFIITMFVEYEKSSCCKLSRYSIPFRVSLLLHLNSRRISFPIHWITFNHRSFGSQTILDYFKICDFEIIMLIDIARHLRNMNLKQRDQPLEEMKKEKSPVSSDDKKKNIVSKLSRLSIDNNVFEGSTDLPQVFQVEFSNFSNKRSNYLSLVLIFTLDVPIKYVQLNMIRTVLHCDNRIHSKHLCYVYIYSA